jgi:hypothetical protein
VLVPSTTAELSYEVGVTSGPRQVGNIIYHMLPGIGWLQTQLDMTRYIERHKGYYCTQKRDVRRLRDKAMKERLYLYRWHGDYTYYDCASIVIQHGCAVLSPASVPRVTPTIREQTHHVCLRTVVLTRGV